MLSVVSWNVNSIRARLDRATAWIDRHKPDVLCLQELKVEQKDFPLEPFRERGYHVHGTYQRTYNGVGIASRVPLGDPTVGLGDGVDDTQARIVSGTIGASGGNRAKRACRRESNAPIAGIRVITCYVPNGQSVGSDKYVYKMEWMKRLRAYLDRNHTKEEKLLICGDFNVAPEERDVHDPAFWSRTTLFHQTSRDALAHVLDFGLVDTLRLHRQDAGIYSWWDYRMLSFPRNNGLRIDFVFATRSLAELCREVVIDREERKGKLPSDHAPVVARFDLPAPPESAPGPPPGQGSLPL